MPVKGQVTTLQNICAPGHVGRQQGHQPMGSQWGSVASEMINILCDASILILLSQSRVTISQSVKCQHCLKLICIYVCGNKHITSGSYHVRLWSVLVNSVILLPETLCVCSVLSSALPRHWVVCWSWMIRRCCRLSCLVATDNKAILLKRPGF